MKQKSKILIALVLLVSILLVACGSSTTTTTAGTTTGTTAAPGTTTAPGGSAPATKKDKYVVGFSQVGSESEWRIAMTKEVQAAYEKHPRFELIFSDAQQKQENQITAVRNFIQQKVDAILLCPVVATGWDAVLTEAKEAKIPVLIVNRRATMAAGKIEEYTATYIGPDNIYAGELAANTMLDIFKDKEGPIGTVLLEGTVGASSAVDRAKGIDNVLKGQTKLEVLYKQSGDYTRSKGKEVMESILKSAKADGKKIEALLSHSDDMAIGASQAIEEAGLKPGEDIKIIGIDGVRGAFEAMVAGKYSATVENPLGYGDKTIEVLLAMLDEGKMPEEWVKLKNNLFTQDQAAAALPNRTY